MADGLKSEIIKTKPISKGLNAFRDTFESICRGLAISGPGALHHISGEGRKNCVLDLISALQVLPASRSLPSKGSNINLFGDLLALSSAVNSGSFDIKRIIPLLEAVLNNGTDELIWNKVYDTVTATKAFTVVAKPTTPPQSGPSLTSSFQQTPWTFNTGSFADTSDLRKDVDPILKGEVEDNLRIDHPDVFTAFFRQIPQLHDMATAVFQSCKDAKLPLFKEEVSWLKWPEGCEEVNVLQFLRRHIDQFLLFADEHASVLRSVVAALLPHTILFLDWSASGSWT